MLMQKNRKAIVMDEVNIVLEKSAIELIDEELKITLVLELIN